MFKDDLTKTTTDVVINVEAVDEEFSDEQLLDTPNGAVSSDNKEQSGNGSKKEDLTEHKYHVYANLNIPQDEDFTFLVTALYEWEKKYPSFTSKL